MYVDGVFRGSGGQEGAHSPASRHRGRPTPGRCCVRVANEARGGNAPLQQDFLAECAAAFREEGLPAAPTGRPTLSMEAGSTWIWISTSCRCQG